MKELINEIIQIVDEMRADLIKYRDKGVKAAGRRARIRSLELEKKAKEFRKVSCETKD